MSRFNVYELVFNSAILNCMDSWECFPDLHIYWDSWQGLVTLRIESSQTVFRIVLGVLQTCTDLLMRNDHLFEPVLIDASLATKVGTNTKVQPYTLPFLIMTIQVPKNFIKKLVGYQERSLVELRKRYGVDFDYENSLVIDQVFNLDETSTVYIYGRGPDVVKVSHLLQCEMNKLLLRTMNVSKEVCKFVLDNIKEIKSFIDTCEIRVKRQPPTRSVDIKHPFYFVPITTMEICLIGSEAEVNSGEIKLTEFMQYRTDAPDLRRTTLCFLLPVNLRSDLLQIKERICWTHKDVSMTHFEP
jgi:hypothetical protein